MSEYERDFYQQITRAIIQELEEEAFEEIAQNLEVMKDNAIETGTLLKQISGQLEKIENLLRK